MQLGALRLPPIVSEHKSSSEQRKKVASKMTTDTFPKVLTSSDGINFTFNSPKQLFEFAESESEKLSWFPNAYRSTNSRPAEGIFIELLDIAALKSVLINQNNLPESVKLERIQDLLIRFLQLTPPIHSQSEFFKYAFNIYKISPAEAFWTVAFARSRLAGSLFSTEHHLNASGAPEGLVHALVWEKRGFYQDRLDALCASAAISNTEISTLVRSANEQHSSIRDLHETIKNDAQKAAIAHEEQLNAQTSRFTEQISLSSVRADDEIRTIRETWERIKTTYEEKLELEAPGIYWRRRSTSHKNLAIAFGIVTGIIAAIGLLCVIALLEFYLGTSSLNHLPSWGDSLGAASVVVVVLWVLRTLLRITMSHLHLSIDANERRIMISSYLALTRRGKTTGDERAALYTAIFRPTEDGIVKDESPPLPLWEIVKGRPGN